MAQDQNKSAIKGLKRKNIIRKLLNSKKKKNSSYSHRKDQLT